mgnify:FL=1
MPCKGRRLAAVHEAQADVRENMSKTIQLSQGKVAVVDDADFDYLNRFCWFAGRSLQASTDDVFYAQTNQKLLDGRSVTVYMHRVLMQPKGKDVVDHLDRDGLNNRRSNLRVTPCGTNVQRQYRIRRIGKSGFRGVRQEGPSRFAAILCADYKQRRLGMFLTAEDAAMAYDKAALERFGEVAALTFPPTLAALK